MSLERPNEPPFPVNRYDRQDDMIMRLDRSIVRYKDIPVYIRASQTVALHVDCRDIVKDCIIAQNVHSSNHELDISAPPLGYVNRGTHCAYASRIPRRSNKQGLDMHNIIYVFDIDGPEINTIFYDSFPNKFIGLTIMNEYPKAAEVLTAMRKSDAIRSRAFHQKFAFVKDDIGIIKLKHMSRTIGFITPKEDQVVIPEELDHQYFTKTLQEGGLEVC
jgi:hypothetical protein